MKVKALNVSGVAGLLRPMLQDINVVSAPDLPTHRDRGDHGEGNATMRA